MSAIHRMQCYMFLFIHYNSYLQNRVLIQSFTGRHVNPLHGKLQGCLTYKKHLSRESLGMFLAVVRKFWGGT